MIPTTYDMGHRHWVKMQGRRGPGVFGQDPPLPGIPTTLPDTIPGYVSNAACDGRVQATKDTGMKYAIGAGAAGLLLGAVVVSLMGKG